jgi:hypothetical protein
VLITLLSLAAVAAVLVITAVVAVREDLSKELYQLPLGLV